MGITVRREEIAIMKYIGAKDGFVRAPFVIEGLVIGIVGAIIPLILLYFMYNKAVEYAKNCQLCLVPYENERGMKGNSLYS